MQPRGGQILLARVSFLVGILNQWFPLVIIHSGFVFISILVPPAPRACPGRPPRTRPLPGSRAGRRPRSSSGSPLGGRGREGGSSPSRRFAPGTWFPCRRAEDGAGLPYQPRRPALGEMVAMRCRPPPSLPRGWQNSTAWIGDAGRALLRPFPRQVGRSTGVCRSVLQALLSAARAEGACPVQAAVSGLHIPAGTPSQSLCRGISLRSPHGRAGDGERSRRSGEGNTSHKTPAAAKLPQPRSPHGRIWPSRAFPVCSFPRTAGGKGPFFVRVCLCTCRVCNGVSRSLKEYVFCRKSILSFLMEETYSPSLGSVGDCVKGCVLK